MRSYEKWTPQEHAHLVHILEHGKTRRQAAVILKRSQSAVAAQVFKMGIRRRPYPSLPPTPSISVAKEEVADWYLVGWRFVGFSHAGLCNMERPT